MSDLEVPAGAAEWIALPKAQRADRADSPAAMPGHRAATGRPIAPRQRRDTDLHEPEPRIYGTRPSALTKVRTGPNCASIGTVGTTGEYATAEYATVPVTAVCAFFLTSIVVQRDAATGEGSLRAAASS
jgi:hypothetical protein